MATSKKDVLSETKRLMGALVRMPPKPHEEMKVGKNKKQRSLNVSPNQRKKVKQRPA